MKFVGNFKKWIDPNIMEIMLTTSGEKRPLDNDTTIERKQEVLQKWLSVGYDIKKLSWEFFYEEHVGNISLPIPTDLKYKWWFSKMNPGDMFPLHVDEFPYDEKNIKRYWMAMQDILPGHVFIHKDKPLDYSAGDMYEFNDARDWHGAVNIGFVPKISYQLVIFGGSLT
jgi:hypothetical protein